MLAPAVAGEKFLLLAHTLNLKNEVVLFQMPAAPAARRAAVIVPAPTPTRILTRSSDSKIQSVLDF